MKGVSTLLKWISEIKHRQLIRAAEREKELAQVMCAHEYEYCGNYRREVYNGIDVDFVTTQRAECIKCRKVVSRDSYNTLAVICRLERGGSNE